MSDLWTKDRFMSNNESFLIVVAQMGRANHFWATICDQEAAVQPPTGDWKLVIRDIHLNDVIVPTATGARSERST